MRPVTTDRDLVLSRFIAATPAKVWRCWTDPSLIVRWFGPDGHSCVTHEIDLSEGGVWRFDMIAPDGTIWRNRHRITRHLAQSRIEFLMDSDDDTQAPMQVVVTLEPEGAGTRLTQTITLASAADKQRVLGFGADRLGLQTLAKLAAVALTL